MRAQQKSCLPLDIPSSKDLLQRSALTWHIAYCTGLNCTTASRLGDGVTSATEIQLHMNARSSFGSTFAVHMSKCEIKSVAQNWQHRARVHASNNRLLQIGIVHGEMSKICPHTSTGRADYFGSTVNRAARLLCAASAGQTLVEAHVMEDVLKHWSGEAYNLSPRPKEKDPRFGIMHLSASGGEVTLGAKLLESGALPLPTIDSEAVSTDDHQENMIPRIKSAPQLSALDIPGDGNISATADAGPQQPAEDTALMDNVMPLELKQAGRSESGGMKGWTPRAPHAGMLRSSLAIRHGRFSKQAVSFAPGPARESRMSSIASFSPRRSVDGVSYDDSELEQHPMTDSCCAPFAATSPLAVSNCHMLKFLAASGTLQGREEELPVPRRQSLKFARIRSLSANNSPHTSQELPSNLSIRSDSSGTSPGASLRNSLKLSIDMNIKGTAPASPKSRGMNPLASSATHSTRKWTVTVLHAASKPCLYSSMRQALVQYDSSCCSCVDVLFRHVLRNSSVLYDCAAGISAVSLLCTAEGVNNRPVWTPSASQGQSFPVKRAPIEVWGIGAFKFKNIQGVSKVHIIPCTKLMNMTVTADIICRVLSHAWLVHGTCI